jgi:putative flippase GtrA
MSKNIHLPRPLELVSYIGFMTISWALELILFIFLTKQVGMQVFIADVTVLTLGTISSYLVSVYLVFKTKHEHSKLAKFVLVCAAMIVLHAAGVTAMSSIFGKDHEPYYKVIMDIVNLFVGFAFKRGAVVDKSDLDVLSVVKSYQIPLLNRLHIFIRLMTCPFDRIIESIPRDTKNIWEYGAGYGLISKLIKQTGMDIRYSGCDVDNDKQKYLDVASDTPPPGTQVALICDVMYLMNDDEIDNLLSDISTVPTILIKEMSHDKKLRSYLTIFQEKITTKVLRLTTHSDTLRLVDLDAIATKLQANGYKTALSMIDKGYPHPHRLLEATK